VLASAAAAIQVEGATAIENGARASAAGIAIEAVPAYNIKHEPAPACVSPEGAG
jgi:hypothetical protein